MKIIYLILLTLCIISCNDKGKMDMQEAKQASIDSMKIEIQKQKVIDSMNVEMAKIKEQKQEKEVVYVNQNSTTPVPAKKKGWSGAAKGAVIGAGVGAVTGAIVSEKKTEGAIIGGIAGAGIGAGTGAIIDSKKKN